MSYNWWMDKQNVVHHGVLSSHKKLKYWYVPHMDEPWNRAKWKKPVSKDHILYNAINIKYLEYRNLQRQNVDDWLSRVEK